MMKTRTSASSQMSLPGDTGRLLSPEKRQGGSRRIPHLEILHTVQNPSRGIANIVETYRLEVLPIKTRIIHLLGRKAPAQIIETLLGYEVKSRYKRIHCHDMVTARYVKLFSELGCRTIRLPYDPTVTARLIPDFERTAEAIRRGVQELFPQEHSLQIYVLRQLYKRLRAQLKAAARSNTVVPTDNTAGL
jgi:hypothetical protein